MNSVVRAFARMAVLALSTANLHAATFEATSEVDLPDVLPGDSICRASNGQCTLRAAIQEANATPGYDQVRLVAQNYAIETAGTVGDDDDAARGDLDIREPLQLSGTLFYQNGVTHRVAIRNRNFNVAAPAGRIFDIHASASTEPVRLERLDITFGGTNDALGGSGVLLREGARAEFDRIVWYANFGASRGTALAAYGEATLSNCSVVDNHIAQPILIPNVIGTIYVGPSGKLDADHVVFYANSAEVGGAIAAEGNAIVSVRRSSFHSNRTDNRGGAGPDGGLGGAVYLAGSATGVMENATFVGNGGMPEDSALNNSIVVRDAAQLTLRHVSVQGFPLRTLGNGSATLTLANSILFNNNTAAQLCSGHVLSQGGNVLGSTTQCPFVLQSGDAAVASLEATVLEYAYPVNEPVTFVAPHKLLIPDNPAVLDQAIHSHCPGSDEIGSARPRPSAAGRPRRCDAGAVELPFGQLFADAFED